MHLIIDTGKCIGCGLCSNVCIRDNIRIEDKKAIETGSTVLECFDCGHCASVCPENAITLRNYGQYEVREYDDVPLIDPETMSEFLSRRRSCRWFKKEPITKEELEPIVRAADVSPTAENSQNVAVAVIDRRMSDFMKHIRPILESARTEFPRIDQFCRYVDNGMKEKNNPLIWEGKQMIVVFSRIPEDAMLAMGRMEMMAYASGFGGFYSRWILMAESLDHEELMRFFPDIPAEMKMGAVFVIGRPRVKYRRSVPRRERATYWE